MLHRRFTVFPYHCFRHRLAYSGAASGAEQDLPLEDIVLENCGRVRGRRFNISLRHIAAQPVVVQRVDVNALGATAT